MAGAFLLPHNGRHMTEIAAFVWAGLATIGALGAAFIRWRSSSDETTAVLWREEAAAWKAKAERLEQSLLDLTRRVDHLEAENKALRTLHDSRSDVAALRESLTSGLADIRARLEILTEGKQ